MAEACGEGEELFLLAVYRRFDAASTVGVVVAFAVACVWTGRCGVARYDSLVKRVMRKRSFKQM